MDGYIGHADARNVGAAAMDKKVIEDGAAAMDKNSGKDASDEDLGSSDGKGANSTGTCFNGLHSFTILSTPQHAKSITLLLYNLYSPKYQAK